MDEYQRQWREQNKQRLKEYNKEWAKQNKEKRMIYGKKWREDNPEKTKEYHTKYDLTKRHNAHLKRKFGITIEDYETMLDKQQGGCAICGKTEEASKQKLAVDHCHSTGFVRGILCRACNTAIGLFEDNVETMSKAIEYLNESSSRHRNRSEAPENLVGSD